MQPLSKLPSMSVLGVAMGGGEKGSPKRYRPGHGVLGSSPSAPAAAACSRGVPGMRSSGGVTAAEAALRRRQLSHLRRGVAGRASSLAPPPAQLCAGRDAPLLAAALPVVLANPPLETARRLPSELASLLSTLPAAAAGCGSPSRWRCAGSWSVGTDVATAWPAQRLTAAAGGAAIGATAGAKCARVGLSQRRAGETGGSGFSGAATARGGRPYCSDL